jgi:SAM-dependent methyltransferase
MIFGSTVAILSIAPAVGQEADPDAPPFVATPHFLVQHMLAMAAVTADDVVYDLGSGDGRIVIAAARDFRARGVGIDLDPERIRESRQNAREASVEDRVQFIEGDLFEADIRDATVVTLYLWAEMNVKLRPRLLTELRPGTVIVAHTFAIGDWKPDRTIVVEDPPSRHNVFLWRVPARVAGEWRWMMDGREYALNLGQSFQEVSGSIVAGGGALAITDATLDGDRLQFTVPASGPSGAARRFTGQVQGDRILGAAEGAGRQQSWSAIRTRADAIPH